MYAICHTQLTDNCTTGEIRLAGANNPRMGRVEICIDGQWGTICDSSWTASDERQIIQSFLNIRQGCEVGIDVPAMYCLNPCEESTLTW